MGPGRPGAPSRWPVAPARGPGPGARGLGPGPGAEALGPGPWARGRRERKQSKQARNAAYDPEDSVDRSPIDRLKRLAEPAPACNPKIKENTEKTRQALQEPAEDGELVDMNPSQSAAVVAALGRSLTMIQGPPGTPAPI